MAACGPRSISSANLHVLHIYASVFILKSLVFTFSFHVAVTRLEHVCSVAVEELVPRALAAEFCEQIDMRAVDREVEGAAFSAMCFGSALRGITHTPFSTAYLQYNIDEHLLSAKAQVEFESTSNTSKSNSKHPIDTISSENLRYHVSLVKWASPQKHLGRRDWRRGRAMCVLLCDSAHQVVLEEAASVLRIAPTERRVRLFTRVLTLNCLLVQLYRVLKINLSFYLVNFCNLSLKSKIVSNKPLHPTPEWLPRLPQIMFSF